MMDLFVAILEQMGLPGASILFGIAWYLPFLFCDYFFPEHTKVELTKRLNRQSTISWSSMVIRMTERIFVGTKPSPYNRPKFWRTSCVSFFWAFVLFIAFFLSSPSFRVELDSVFALVRLLDLSAVHVFLAFGFGFFLLNPIADYCSLIETRLILKSMDSAKSVTTIVSLAILDGVLTFVIIWLLFPLLFYLVTYLTGSSTLFFDYTLERIWNGFWLRTPGADLTVYIYTTFATSVWIWLYLLAETVFRLFPYFQKTFPIVERPFQSIGFVISILAGFGYFMVGLMSAVVSAP